MSVAMGRNKGNRIYNIRNNQHTHTYSFRIFFWVLVVFFVVLFVSCGLNIGGKAISESSEKEGYSEQTTGISGTSCATSADCPEGYLCVNSRCVEVGSCQVDLDCPQGYSCGSRGRCVPVASCQVDADCPQGYICSSGKCVESSGKTEATQVGHQGKPYFASPTFDLSGFYSTPTRKNVSEGTLKERWKVGPLFAVYITVGDVNGDGNLEIVAGSLANKVVNIYSSTGELLYSIVRSDAKDFRTSLIADTTGDGVPEILIGLRDSLNYLKIAIYSGLDGSLVKILTYGQGGYDSSIIPAYVKGDIVISWLYAGDSCMPRGAFAINYDTEEKVWEVLYGDAFSGLAFSDIDGDGRIEIGGSSHSRQNNCSAGGTKDNEIWAKVIKDDGTEVFKVPVSSFYGTSYVRGGLLEAFSDLDGDGSDEIIVFENHDSSYPGTNAIHLLDKTGVKIQTFYGEESGGWWTFSIADINGDGYREIIASGRDGQDIYIVKHDLTGYISILEDGGVILGTNDIDGDGQIEIIAFDKTRNRLRVLNPDLSEQWSYTFSASVAGSMGGVDTFAISDLDEDGINEIIICPCWTGNEYLYVLEPQ